MLMAKEGQIRLADQSRGLNGCFFFRGEVETVFVLYSLGGGDGGADQHEQADSGQPDDNQGKGEHKFWGNGGVHMARPNNEFSK